MTPHLLWRPVGQGRNHYLRQACLEVANSRDPSGVAPRQIPPTGCMDTSARSKRWWCMRQMTLYDQHAANQRLGSPQSSRPTTSTFQKFVEQPSEEEGRRNAREARRRLGLPRGLPGNLPGRQLSRRPHMEVEGRRPPPSSAASRASSR